MATLTQSQLERLRRLYHETMPTVYSKPQLNAVFQAVEDWMIANQASASAAMGVALPAMTNAEKKIAFADYCYLKYLADK
jgi:hypothetical protein